ncbi:MAG: hypothetical protein H3C47_05465 [Candidatus Cloacimonetes bacterium]|nr:hypothetical protein [Candidatus Cloacimonadota bacterium]
MNQVEKPQVEDEIDLFELFAILYRRKWFILGFTALISGLSIWYALSRPNIYKAQATLLPPSSGDKGKLAGMLGQLSALPLLGMGGLGGTDNANSFDILKAHLQTRENLWKVIDSFGLKEHLKVESKFREDVEQAYLKALNIDSDKKSGIIKIAYSDTDPQLAARIVNMNVEMLDQISREKVVSENRKKRMFLEERLAEATQDLMKAEEEIQKYKKDNRLLTVEGQAKATVEAAFRIQSEILLSRGKLKVRLELGSSDNHPEVKILNLEIQAMEKQLRDMEEGRLQIEPVAASRTELQDEDKKRVALTYIPLAEIPRIELEMERLIRKKLVAQEVFTVLTKEYEVSKIESSKEQEVIQVVELAEPPQKKDKPSRAVIVIVATMAAFMFLCFSVLLMDAIRKRQDSAKTA